MSSVYVYLSKEVKNKEGYKKIQSGQGEEQRTSYRVAGESLFCEIGKFHIRLSNIEDPIPEMLSDIIVGFSCYDWILSEPRRVSGIYKHETAIAIVENKGRNIEMRITAEKIKHLREIYYKIRRGQILPSENWEVEQNTVPSKKTKKKK